MKSEPNVQYQIEMSIFNEKIKDTQSLVILRCPLSKTASFVMHAVNLRARLFLSLQEYTDAGHFITISYRIIVSENFSSDDVIPNEIRDICKKTFICFHMKPLEVIDPQKPWISTLLYLANPILFLMNNSSAYNKIFDNKAPVEILTDFEDYCVERYGNGFAFEKIGIDKEKNSHKYKQLFIKQDSDLMVPSHIINNLKLWHTFGYYFFDDFRFDSEIGSLKDITGWTINLFDYEEFEKRDIMEDHSDYILGLKEIDVQPVTDTFGELQSDGFSHSTIVKGKHQEFGYRKTKEKEKVFKYGNFDISPFAASGPSGGNRDTPYVGNRLEITEKNPSHEKRLYAPDDPLIAEYRYKITGQQLRNKIRALHTFYAANCHFDFFNFGNRYNLDVYAPDEFLHVPVSIVNIFVRNTKKIPLLTHFLQLQTLRYYKSG